MKRGYLLILTGILSTFLVEGQEIRLGNQEISLVLILPLILIVVVGIIFLITFFMDTKRSFLRNPKEISVKPREEIILKPKEWINYLDIIDTFSRRLGDKDTKEAFPQFIKILKGFFKERFNLDYEFTYDELLSELKQRNFPNTQIISYVKDITYKDRKIRKDELYDLIDKLRNLVKIIDRDRLEELYRQKINKNLRLVNRANLIVKNINKRENNIDDRLNKFFIEKTRAIFGHKKIEIKKDFKDFDREKVAQISLLIKQGKKSLQENDIENLKNIYDDICYLFPFLSDNGKKIAYLEILDFYEDINRKLFPELYKKLKFN